ncbi:hypothetical protein CFP65_7539 [Kitasatospora sp. MMS16-BH015]|uniref:M60 family metallopeptidase n=1 Tax=Kitasatospora sp. MMS16-BH015 TaxID=2018025 RepID=UPI000CA09DAF|nr:M60 family metallopeptidase [Kitasatospora sp. MMS16-BH015]AUG82113.1 hypothetical protein CFP65_7539 [Kitasatospora sp. MMS16-BH015]
MPSPATLRTAASLALSALLLPLTGAPPALAHPPGRAGGTWSELRVLGQCLTARDSQEVRLRSCSSELGEPTPAGQRWQLDGQGTLRSALPGSLALGLPPGATAANGARLAAVPEATASGAWSYDSATGHLVWRGGGYTLDFNTGTDLATLWTAGTGDNQKWSFDPGYTATTAPSGADAAELRTEGQCLTLSQVTTPNRSVTVEPCASTAGRPTPATQRWTVTAQGQVQSSAAPYPVLDVQGDPGSRYVVARPVGNGTDRSRWQYDPTAHTLLWAADPTLALDHSRTTAFAGLYRSHGGPNQLWTQSPVADQAGPARTQAAPGPVSATATSPADATLRWTAPTGPAPATYAVYQDGGRIALTYSTSYQDPGLGPGGLHRYRVTAISADGVESAPSAETVLTAPACPRPTGPDGTAPFLPPVAGQPYTLTLTGRPSAQREQQRQGLRQLPSDIRPTGLYLPPDALLTATTTGAAGTGALSVLIGPPVGAGGLAAARRYPIVTTGTGTRITDHRGGMVHLVFDGAPTDRVTLTLSGDTQLAPVFVLGSSTPDQWRADLAARPTRYAELLAGRTVVTLSRDSAARYAYSSPEAVLRHLECARAVEDAVNGLAAPTAEDATTAPGPDSPGVFPFHYVEVERRVGGAFATDRYMGFKDESVAWLADSAAAEWGVWHEQGHHRQQSAITPTELIEVSNNIDSQSLRTAYARPSRLVTQGSYDTALPKLGKPGVAYATSFDGFEQLVMLQQLALQYGAGFWPEVRHRVRTTPPTDPDRWAAIAVLTSQVAGQDLTAFYLAWGVPLTTHAQQAVAALRLPSAPGDLTTRREP